MKTKEEYRHETEAQLQNAQADISDTLLAYEAQKEQEFPEYLSHVETELEQLRNQFSCVEHDENARRKLLTIADVENRLEITAHIWQAAVDYMELPTSIRNLKTHIENKSKVVEALAGWCVAQDEIIQELKALEARLLEPDPCKRPEPRRKGLASTLLGHTQTLPS